MPQLSQRQLQLYGAEAPLVLAVGVVRSGKTYAGCLGFTDYLLTTEPAKHLVSGRSPTELKGEVLPHIRDRARALGCDVSWNNSERTLSLDGHVLYFIAWSNKQSAERIQGMTFRCALLDEVTLVGEDFFDMVVSRLSMAGSRFYGFTNPNAPGHWLKRRIDAKIPDLAVTSFRFEDNPHYWNEEGQAYLARLHRMYAPGSVFYKRFILGQWAAAAGLVYPDAAEKVGMPPPGYRLTMAFAGADFGTTAPSSLVRIEQWEEPGAVHYHVTDSLHVEGSKEMPSHPHLTAQRMHALWLERPFRYCYLDPSAYGWVGGALEAAMPECDFLHATNDVMPGISTVARLFAEGRLTIAAGERTRPLRDELAAYIWDERQAEAAQDKPRKKDDHHVDALRYGLFSEDSRAPLVFDD